MAILICTYNVTSTTEATKICYETYSLTDILYNGVSIGVVTEYQFSSLGEHTLEFIIDGEVVLKKAFYQCYNLLRVIIGDTVEGIGEQAFEYCYSLQFLTIGQNVKSLGAWSFADCTRLLKIVSKAYYAPELEAFAFADIPDGGVLYHRSELSYSSWFADDENDGNLDGTNLYNKGWESIQYNINNIDEIPYDIYALGTTTKLEFNYDGTPKTTNNYTVNLYGNFPIDTIVSEGEDFIVNSNITQITNDLSKYYAQVQTTQNNTNEIRRGRTYFFLKKNYYGYFKSFVVDYIQDANPTLPKKSNNIVCTYNVEDTSTPTKICNNTEQVRDILYNGVSLGVVTEYQFSSLGEHTLEFVTNTHLIDTEIFNNCTSIIAVELPDSIIKLEKGFSNCTNLRTVSLPKSLEILEDYVFNNCTSLQNLELPITLVDFGGLSGCTSITSITLPEGLERIRYFGFRNCTSLEYIEVPRCVTYIDDYVFYNCSSLKWVKLPDSIEWLGMYSFRDCTSLEKIYSLNPTCPSLYKNSTFWGVKTGGTVEYPEGSDYSEWLSTDEYYLGYYGWNGVEFDVDNPPTPEPPVEPDVPTYPDGEIVTPNKTMIIVTSGKTFQYPIETNNIERIHNYYIYFNGNRYSAIDGFISIEMVDNFNFNITVEENDGDERRCSIYFEYIDYNGNLLTHKLTITQDAKYVEPDVPEVTTPYVTGTTTILYFNYDGTPKTTNEFDVYWYGDYYDRNLANDSSHFGVSGKKIETTDDYVKYHYTVNCPQNTTSEVITGSCYFNIKLDASTYGESFVVEFIQDAKPDVPDVPDEPESPSINLEFTNLTVPTGGVTTTLDIETNGVEDIEIIAPEWVEVIDKGGYYEIEVLPNEGTDREGEVIFIGNPNKPNKVQQSIIITQKGNEEMATSIALRKTRLDYTADGGSKYLQVDYVNAQTINAPYCSQSWVTIEQTQSGNTTTNGQPTKQVQYKITMQPSSFARQTNITFSCIGANGNTVSNNKFMVYQAAPALALPTITLEKSSIEFDSTGYAENFSVTVTYADTDTVLEPVVNGDWITVTEGLPVQGGNSGSGTAIVKRYLIEVSETETYRQGTIVFKASNTNGTSNSPFFSVIQKAPVEDEEIVPVISAYTKTATVKYDGSSTGIAITSLGCSYTNVSTVLTPVVNGDWIKLGEGVLQSSSSEDTVIYRYPVSFETNDSVERVGYVKFIGTDENGNEYSDSTKITQQAVPMTPDAPEPELPEVSKEVTYSPIWKDVEYVFVSDSEYGIYYDRIHYFQGQMFRDEILLFKGKAYLPPDDSVVKVCINKICQNYMSENPNIFDGAVGYSHSYNEFKLKDSYGTLLHTYRFVNDWSYKELSLGIKTSPIIPNIADGQKLFFSVFATDEKAVKWGMRYYDGTADYNNTEYVADDFTTVIVPESRQKYVNTFYFGDKSYTSLPRCECKYVFYYMNPYGGYDWLPITGKVVRKDKVEAFVYTKNYNNTTADFGKNRYMSNITVSYNLNTGWLTQEQSDRMWELLESNTVWLHNLDEDRIYPVMITDTNIEHKQKFGKKKRLSYSINVELSQTRERL